MDTLEPVLEFLQEEKIIRRVGSRWHWTADNFPADGVSLRTADTDNFVIIDITRQSPG